RARANHQHDSSNCEAMVRNPPSVRHTQNILGGGSDVPQEGYESVTARRMHHQKYSAPASVQWTPSVRNTVPFTSVTGAPSRQVRGVRSIKWTSGVLRATSCKMAFRCCCRTGSFKVGA